MRINTLPINSPLTPSHPAAFVTLSSEETQEWGEKIGKTLPPRCIVALFGELGAGKTTFAKGLIRGALGSLPEEVSSPTFTYLNIYTGEKTVYHFDLYRLKDTKEFLSMGFDDYLFSEGICCIEWPERIESLLPKETFCVDISQQERSLRHFQIFKRK